jgi:hypothetical protein
MRAQMRGIGHGNTVVQCFFPSKKHACAHHRKRRVQTRECRRARAQKRRVAGALRMHPPYSNSKSNNNNNRCTIKI